jgi:hypothetical protein
MENRRIGSKPSPTLQRNSALQIPSYPVVGIIKNNIDPTRAGRLQVFLPDGGAANENDPSNWVTVSYVSPFRGQTKQRLDLDQYTDSNIDVTSPYENSFQSYGMWFTVPDLNCKVLCVFANGDPAQGYWLGCIGDSFDSHMIPAIGSVTKQSSTNSGGYFWDPDQIPAQQELRQYIELSGVEIPFRLPVSEPTLHNTDSQPQSSSSPAKVQMVPHVEQTKNLGRQGLAFDVLRGTTSASSIRENPSQVFGISTPGRLSPFANASASTTLLTKVNNYVNNNGNLNTPDSEDVRRALDTTYRAGGHTFVMDDGTIDGADQGIRIRTATGHMILMDDASQQIYIVTANGNAWIELTPSGRIDIFANSDFSVRSKGDINFHSDKNINLHAGGDLRMHGTAISVDADIDLKMRSSGTATVFSAGELSVGSDGMLSLYSAGPGNIQSSGDLNINGKKIYLNGSKGPKVIDPGILPKTQHIEVAQQSGSKVWWQNGSFTSITSRATAHEPWSSHEVNGIMTFNVKQGAITGNAINGGGSGTSSGVRGSNRSQEINEGQLAKQPATGAVCGLTVNQTRALFCQIGQRESGLNYNVQNSLGYAGKYQLGADALIGEGFLKANAHPKGTTNLQAINNPANWTGLNGCNSIADFLANGSAQEQAMMGFTKKNCATLRKIGVITDQSEPEQIGGYLMTAHLLGPGGAQKLWQLQNNMTEGADGTDANGTSGSSYYALGSYAVGLGTSTQNA